MNQMWKVAAKSPGLWMSSPTQSKRKQSNSKRPAARLVSSAFCQSLKSLPQTGKTMRRFRPIYWDRAHGTPSAEDSVGLRSPDTNAPIGRHSVHQSSGKGLNFGRAPADNSFSPAFEGVAATRFCGRSRFIPKARKFLLNCLENQ